MVLLFIPIKNMCSLATMWTTHLRIQPFLDRSSRYTLGEGYICGKNHHDHVEKVHAPRGHAISGSYLMVAKGSTCTILHHRRWFNMGSLFTLCTLPLVALR
jgi:hypothetical protein